MNTEKQWILLLTRLWFKRNILPIKRIQDSLGNCWFQVWKKMNKINLEHIVVTECGEIIKGNSGDIKKYIIINLMESSWPKLRDPRCLQLGSGSARLLGLAKCLSFLSIERHRKHTSLSARAEEPSFSTPTGWEQMLHCPNMQGAYLCCNWMVCSSTAGPRRFHFLDSPQPTVHFCQANRWPVEGKKKIT